MVSTSKFVAYTRPTTRHFLHQVRVTVTTAQIMKTMQRLNIDKMNTQIKAIYHGLKTRGGSGMKISLHYMYSARSNNTMYA